MGNSASSSGRGHHDESVDYGYLSPQGIYTGPRDWNQPVVSQLICTRRLAPFYRPLEEYDESWDDDQILAARKDLPDSDGSAESVTRSEMNNSSISKAKRPPVSKEPSKPEASVYRGAVECPICFLYYPPNINHSRCCDQAICTECFVQIKRSEPTTTHLVSEPAACPYCVQDNFGVVYTPPPWRAGIGGENQSPRSDSPKSTQQSIETSSPFPVHKRRQKSFGADSPEVVTTDQIRPDWEAKLTAVRATVTRRANRRIIMRQVGDRLIPVGVTSGRVHPITPEDGSDSNDGGGSRRSRRRQQNGDLSQLLGGLGGQDLEELMIMEAMRLSMIEHEEAQRREAQNRNLAEGTSAEPELSEPPLQAPGDQSSQALNPTNPAPSTSAPASSSESFSPSSHGALSVASSLPISTSSSPVNPISTREGMTDISSSSQHQTSIPPFSALTAAMTAASTVSAASDGGDNSTSTMPPNAPAPIHSSSAGNPVPPNSVAVPAVSHETGIAPSPGPTMSPAQESFASSFTSVGEDEHAEGSSYDFLPSSPESMVSHERLLPDVELEDGD